MTDFPNSEPALSASDAPTPSPSPPSPSLDTAPPSAPFFKRRTPKKPLDGPLEPLDSFAKRHGVHTVVIRSLISMPNGIPFVETETETLIPIAEAEAWLDQNERRVRGQQPYIGMLLSTASIERWGQRVEAAGYPRVAEKIAELVTLIREEIRAFIADQRPDPERDDPARTDLSHLPTVGCRGIDDYGRPADEPYTGKDHWSEKLIDRAHQPEHGQVPSDAMRRLGMQDPPVRDPNSRVRQGRTRGPKRTMG